MPHARTAKPPRRRPPRRPTGARERSGSLHLLAPAPLRVADVALLCESGSDASAYFELKAAWAHGCSAIEHYVVVPGRVPQRGAFAAWRRELASLRLARSCRHRRATLGFGPLAATLRALRPEVVLLHDSHWAAPHVAQVAHEIGALIVIARHEQRRRRARPSPAERLWRAAMRAFMLRSADAVDAVIPAASPCTRCAPAHPPDAAARAWAAAFEAELAQLARLAAGRSPTAARARRLAPVGGRT